MKSTESLEYLLSQADNRTAAVGRKVTGRQRLSADDGLALYQSRDLGLLGALACHVKQQKSGNEIYFNKNFHIEPTNICIHHCRFCSYACHTGDSDSWEESIEEVANTAKRYEKSDITEVHIVGGVHPDRDVYYYAGMLRAVRAVLPKVHIKAFSAVELEYMFAKASVTDCEGFEILKQAGLQSIPGGGAEIFDEEIRQQICPEKTGSQRWLDIHRAAHRVNVLSNATMLYGHVESYENRIDHLMRLRALQDETHGFNAFIPLKFRMANNPMSHVGEVTAVEDLKNYAVSRIFLDNIPHIKAYWPMIGRDMAQMALSFGADDVDGTIDDTTKIYSMAGADDQKPAMTTAEMMEMIRKAGYQPVERDSLYRPVK
jgi:aminodeoxyfutalosine synthase